MNENLKKLPPEDLTETQKKSWKKMILKKKRAQLEQELKQMQEERKQQKNQ
jgi:hypothetical protein